MHPARRSQNDHMYQFTTIEAISEHGFPSPELYKVCLVFILSQDKRIDFRDVILYN